MPAEKSMAIAWAIGMKGLKPGARPFQLWVGAFSKPRRQQGSTLRLTAVSHRAGL